MQVHRATLNGEEGVIKVQRPGLRELFEVDLRNIRVLAVWLQAADPKSDGAARDWVAIYDECSKILYEVRCHLTALMPLHRMPEQRSRHAAHRLLRASPASLRAPCCTCLQHLVLPRGAHSP